MSQLKTQANAEGAVDKADKLAHEPKRLFKYYMDRNIEMKNQELNFFNRTQRWRYNTRTKNHGFKWYRAKYPLILGIGFTIGYDWIVGWDGPSLGGH